MHDILESIAAANGWVFKYARRDFLNLFDEIEEEDKIHIFLDPVEIEDNDNENGVTDSKTNEGSFLMVYSSSLDEESYEVRYEKYIKPIIETEIKNMKEVIVCNNDLKFNKWRSQEVINILDYNLDGAMVTFSAEIEV